MPLYKNGGGSPGGADTQVQFNDGGAFGGEANLTWDKTNNRLGIGTSAAAYHLDITATTTTYTCPDPTGTVTITPTYEVGDYSATGITHKVRVYLYYESPLGRVYSTNYIESSPFTDPADESMYQLTYDWSTSSGTFTGYKILKYDDVAGYNFDKGVDVEAPTVTLDDTGMNFWESGDGDVATKSLTTTPGDAIHTTGNVLVERKLGAGTVSPSATAHIVGIATNQPPLLVNYGSSSATNLAEFYNGATLRTRLLPSGIQFWSFDSNKSIAYTYTPITGISQADGTGTTYYSGVNGTYNVLTFSADTRDNTQVVIGERAIVPTSLSATFGIYQKYQDAFAIQGNGGSYNLIKVLSADGSYLGGMSQDGRLSIGSSAPITSAALEVSSTNAALVVSRMTSAQRDAMTAATGMIIYNTNSGTFQGRTSASWADLH